MSSDLRVSLRGSRLFIAVVALVTGMALLPAVAAAGEADASTSTADRLAMMRAVGSSDGSSSASTFQQQQVEPDGLGRCFEDPQGDTRRLDNDSAVNQPEADLLTHCVHFGPSLALTAQVARPTDPLEDDNWDGATFVGWFIDTDNDDEGEFFVDYSLSPQRDLVSTVHDIRDPDETSQTCSEPATYTGHRDREDGRFAAVLIRPACIGGADEVRVNAAMYYDTSAGQGDESDVYYDTSPGDGVFTQAVQQVGRDSGRLAGRDRMVTSTRISQERFPQGADVVYLARQDLFADAVAGGVLTDGPILLVPSCGTAPQEVRDEVDRVGPEVVIGLGGIHAICDDTLEETAGGRDTDRLAGEERIETSVEISQRAFPERGDARFVFLARADVFADAVTGGVLTDGPILLVNPCGPAHEDVQAEIERLDPERVIALGGIHAICDETHDSAAGGHQQQRLFGATRIETAVEISRFQFPATTPSVYISRADLFADAVVGGVLTDGPILLVPRCMEEAEEFPEAVRREVSRTSPDRLFALGGEQAICDFVLSQAVDS